MGIKRYLIYFSYIGTQFRGVQRQVNRNLIANADPSTVQGLIEYAITRLKPKNEIVLYLASRTDQGVHALKTAAAIDLDFDYDITPLYIHNFLNGFFDETELDIRILEVLRVSKDFNARKLPLWRKYIYRFATIKPDATIPEHLIRKKLLPVPITEKHRCYYVPQKTFDIEKFNSAAELFIGTKDFISFMAKGGEVTEEVSTVRRINNIGVERAQPFIPSPIDENYNYWHLFCEGKSFLYKQIRKTVSILLAVAESKISLNTVEKMIEEPSPNIWPRNVHTAPSHGLYLADVFYHPQDLEVPQDELEVEEKEQNKENVYNDESLDNMDPLEKNKILIKRRLAKYKDNQDETVQHQS